MTTASLRCPTCSAPLDPPSFQARTMQCPYCGANAVLTQRLGTVEAQASPERQTGDVAEVVRLLRAGRTIEAIKVYRERFGVGLKEAKEAVERIAAVQPTGARPASTPAGSKRSVTWAAVAALVLGATGLLIARGGEEPVPTAGASSSTEQATPWAGLGTDGAPAGFAEEVLRFGSEGTGAGRFEDARSVAVDGAGRLYVAEYQGGRVQVFDTLGTFLTQWMANPDMPLQDLAAERGGAVYVVQSGRIRRYDGSTGELLAELPGPSHSAYTDVTVALDGSLWAVAFPATLVHLDRDGEVIRTIDARAVIHDGALPERVAVSGTGELYVTDRHSGEIYRLSPSGRFVDRFGGRGDRPDNLRSPHDITIDGRGRVYVSDLGAGIRVFGADGHFLGAFGGNAVVFGLAVDDRDALVAAYRNDHQVARFRLPR